MFCWCGSCCSKKHQALAKALVEFVLGSLGGLAFCSAKGGWHGIPAVGKVDSMLVVDRNFLGWAAGQV